MFLERNILEPYFLVCTVIIFSPRDFFIQNGGYSGNLCSTGSLSFFHDFFLGIRLNSLLEITAFAFNPSKLFYDGNRALYQPV